MVRNGLLSSSCLDTVTVVSKKSYNGDNLSLVQVELTTNNCKRKLEIVPLMSPSQEFPVTNSGPGCSKHG